MLNPNTSPTSANHASKVQATTSGVQATTSKVQASDMQVTTHNSDTRHRPNVNDSITLSAHQLANIQDTLHHYKDGITSIAGVLSVISHNPHLHDYQHQALIDVLQNYCECVLSDIGNPSSKLISSALQETGYYKPSLPNI